MAEMTEDEKQAVHEQRQRDDPGHDRCSCWCCCWSCDEEEGGQGFGD